MRAKNGQTYKTNYERAVSFFETTLAPVQGKTKGEQEVHDLFLSILGTFEKKNETLAPKPTEDVSFATWENQKGREKDVKAIRGIIEKINEFFTGLMEFTKAAEWDGKSFTASPDAVKLKKSFFQIMELSGVKTEKKEEIQLILSKDCAQGLQKLLETAENAAKDEKGEMNTNKAFVLFEHAVFHPELDWLVESYDYMMKADGALIKLCEALEKNGFKRELFIEGNYLSLNYIIDFGKKPEPLKKSFGEKNHLGLEVSFENINVEPGNVWMRIPQFKRILQEIDALTPEVKKFISDCTKTCDGCRYCVQMDKTKTKPLEAVSVDGTKKCPRYPAFSMRFTSFEKDRAAGVQGMLLELKKFLA